MNYPIRALILLQDQTVSNKKILELALINYKHIILEDKEQLPEDYFEQIAYAVKEDEQQKDQRIQLRKQIGFEVTESIIPIASHHRLYDVFYASAKKHNFTIVKKELEE